MIAFRQLPGRFGDRAPAPIVSRAPKYPPIRPGSGLDVGALKNALDGPEAPARERVRKLVSRPDFALGEHRSAAEHRELVLAWCRTLADAGIGGLLFPKEFGGGGDPAAFFASFETLAHHDLSLTIKFGVQFGLFAGSIHHLGTRSHHRTFLPRALSLDLPGCFAMTETGHGSNVRGLETTATYDPKTKVIVINSPTESSGKNYIGNAAEHGRMATVFAQLRSCGRSFGVHAVLVPIRDRRGNTLPGVRIEDCGEKLGLGGVDNGRLWFDHVEVPLGNLLDRFGRLSEDGTYSSPIEDENRRFFTMLSTLVGGRVSIAASAVSASKTGLAIAVRYASRRRQFGDDGRPETLLLDYPSHRARLLPALAKTYAMHFAVRELVASLVDSEEGVGRQIETRAAALKASATWNNVEILQLCRECCGGEGYLAVNRFADLKADTDIFTTFEGDNTVLAQLAAKGLLGDFKGQLKTGELTRGGLAARELGERFAKFGRSPRRANDLHLIRHLVRRREDVLTLTIGKSFAGTAGRRGSYAAITAHQNDLIALSEAHAERLALDAFATAAARCADPTNRAVLLQLCALYGIDRLRAHRAWHLESRTIGRGLSRSLDHHHTLLCAELAPSALPLTDAFAIPPACLRAPIALD